MQIHSSCALHLDDATVALLLDPASVTDVVGDAFGAWGRGEAATTQRVRSSASGMMASAMAAVVPPYSGGKLYATIDGVFTFVNVLFDAEGRFLCTLDGDVLTRLRTPAASALAIRAHGRCRRPHRGDHRLGPSGLATPGDARGRAAVTPSASAVLGRRPAAVAALVTRAVERGIPAVAARECG